MEFTHFKDLFTEIFQLNSLQAYISDENIEKFYHLTRLMLEKNAVMNITAIRDIEKIIPLHYADCAMVAPHIPFGAKVMDIGCGGGFPTLPLAMIRPDINIVGVDSTEKKVKYVAETAETLELSNVSAISARAEELVHMPDMRESFDVVTSRAVARLNVLDELCMPFLKIDGRFVIMKGAAGQEELNEARGGIEKLGGKVTLNDNKALMLDQTNFEKRVIIIVDKVNQTPLQYPRQFGQIKKKPL